MATPRYVFGKGVYLSARSTPLRPMTGKPYLHEVSNPARGIQHHIVVQTKGEDLTSCADNDIELLNCSIDKFNAVGQNLFNWRGNKIALTRMAITLNNSRENRFTPYVIFAEGLKITRSRC